MPQLSACAACDQWYRLKAEEAAQALMGECERNVQQNAPRRAEALMFASLFEGLSLLSFDEHGYQHDDDEVFGDLDIPIVRNTCRSIVQTAVSKIAAQDSPLPQFMSNGGDWVTRTKAVRLDRLVTAEYEQPQGDFSNLHSLFRHGATIAMAATGSFAVFFFAGPDGLIAELDDTLSLGVEHGGRYGRIVSMTRKTWYNAEELITRYPKFEDEILKAEERMPNGVSREDADLTPERGVAVFQGWRSALGKKSFGRELFCLKDGTILRDNKKYDRSSPPVVFWHYERSLFGHWGVSLTRSIYNQCVRINQIIADVDYAEHNSPQGLVLHKKGATAPGDTDKVRGWQFVEITGAADMANAFHAITPPKYNDQSVELMLLHEAGAHDISGVSDQHTSAKRAVGTTSGKHENMVAALFTQRFAHTERELIETRTTKSARIIVWCLQDQLEEDSEYKRIYAKGDYVEEVKLADLDLDLDRYTISIAPVSEDKQSPRARLERMDEAFDAGLITGADLLSFQQDFDAKAPSALAIAQNNWVERQIDKWMHADDVEYQGPVQWMDLQSAARMVAQAMLIARTKGLPDERLGFFTRFLDEVQSFIESTGAGSASQGALGMGAGPSPDVAAEAGVAVPGAPPV
jgi:hypothetical protein